MPDLLTLPCPCDAPLDGAVPVGLTIQQAAELRQRDSDQYRQRALDSMAKQMQGMLALQKLGSVTLDFTGQIHSLAHERGLQDAIATPSLMSEYLDPVIRSHALVTCVALSGEPSDIARTEQLALELFPENGSVRNWLALVKRRVRFQGLPARVCWFERRQLPEFVAGINQLVAKGELKAPIVISSEGRISNAEASAVNVLAKTPGAPETPSRSQITTALLNIARGASWGSVQNVASDIIEYPYHLAYAVAVDGTHDLGERIEHLLTNHGLIG